MKIIGITGGVGAGKSSVLNAIKQKYKCEMTISDDAANDIKKRGNSCYEDIVNLLGKDILSDDLEIDKKKMAAKIFDNQELLQRVNDIIHPAVKEYILNKIDIARECNDIDFFFIEAALLIECGYKTIVDEMWYIYATDDIRRKRLKDSRGYDDKKIDAIFASQLSEEEFKINSDFIIDNSGLLDDSILQIEKRIGR